jgi:signal transduction histidine kinase/ligand-binding sensor domain-containing protein/AraC-like DNA-binding protein
LGYIWIATLDGLNRYNGYEFLQYRHDANDSTSIDNIFVFALLYDSSHRLWVGTSTGINLYDFASNSFVRYRNSGTNGYSSFFEDHKGRIWGVGLGNGLAYLDTLSETVIFLPDSPHNITSIWEDNAHRLWMGAFDEQGLVLMKDGAFEQFTLPGSRSVTCIYKDRRDMWWLGTNAGIVVFDPLKNTFNYMPFSGSWNVSFIKEIEPMKLLIGTNDDGLFLYDIVSRQLSHNEPHKLNPFHSLQMQTCYIDSRNNVWVGTFDKGFFVWNKILDYFNTDFTLDNHFKDKFITRIIEDKSENIWISTRYDGLFCYTPDRQIISYNAQKNPDLFSEQDKYMESILIDSKNRIWIGMSNRLIVGKLISRESIQAITSFPVHARSIKEDRQGNIWIGTVNEGLFKAEYTPFGVDIQPVTEQFNISDICIRKSGEVLFTIFGNGIQKINLDGSIEQIQSDSPESKKIAARCITLFEDSKQCLWIGSYSSGMACLSEGKYSIFTINDGLPNNNVLCFLEDAQGDIWISTSNGISKLRLSDTVFTNYLTSGSQYFEKSGLKPSDGRIFFGGSHGLISFNPAIVLHNKYSPKIGIEDLKISNQSVKPGSKSPALSKSILFTDAITLNHKQTFISLDYVGIDYLLPDKLTYKYKMEGFDEEWTYAGNRRSAFYSNLPSGKYVFMVKAINDVGMESASPACLSITVKPAPWWAWWAWMLYLITFLSLIFFMFRTWYQVKMNRQLLRLEHQEKEREREISEMKITFFTNISHELRTPLTLIASPLEQLLNTNVSDANKIWLLKIISRNVQNMLRLINQLIDFRKIEDGVLSLQVHQVDLIQNIRNIQDTFAYPFERKKINFMFYPHISELNTCADTDKTEKILNNLLSNALKYTPENGTIEIHTAELSGLEVANKYRLYPIQEYPFIEISVSNTGPDVPADKLDELFVRYRQIKYSSGNKPDYSGSGIGLHYTKRLVEKHYGKICAGIKPGGGMIFSFVLPLADVYSEQEKETPPDVIISNEIKAITPDGVLSETVRKEHSYCILIVEDNIELMDFIRNVLNDSFRLLEAPNGEKAWNIVQNVSVDLILSDVIMPEISGYQLCSLVKESPTLCHIPVVLLTAKSAVNDQIEGLEHGADAYICKPFHVNYLLTVIKSLFANRARLRQYFSLPQEREETPIPVIINENDQKFLGKLTRLLDRELPEHYVDLDSITKEMGFSRTGFYRKIKGLTDLSPFDFIHNYRMRRAAEMITEKVPFIEVAEKTGFGSYSYFSKAFKKYYGISPREYKEKTNVGM